jgi:hypothetical protein
MGDRNHIIRTLTRAEVVTLVDWAAGEGWNPGLLDPEAFRAADRKGFIGSFVDDEMVAGISAVAYGERYGFIGLYICRPDMRGRGHGRAVWAAGTERLQGRTVGLDGVDAQFENYRRKGFDPAYRTIRFGGRVGSLVASESVRPTTDKDRTGIFNLDRRCFPAPRQSFLDRWLAPPHRTVVSRNGNEISGYAVMRQCREGWKVGPIFAENEDVAASLLASLTTEIDGKVYIDVPAYQDPFISQLRNAGLEPGFETTRMYTGPAPDVEGKVVFGVTSLELG